MTAVSARAATERDRGDIVAPVVYLLADHLDAALALAEDLASEHIDREHLVAGDGMRAIQRQTRDLTCFIDQVRVLEVALIGRMMQARKRAEEVRAVESRFKPLVQLFHAGTAVLIDAVAEFGDPSATAATTGNTAAAYMQSRQIATIPAEGAEAGERYAVNEEFLVASRIRLGTLMDLIATVLDSLDLAFDLYASARGSGLAIPGEPAATASEFLIAPDVRTPPRAR